MRLEAQVRRIQRVSGVDSPSLGEFGETLITQLLPKYAALNKAGKLFGVDTSGGTAQAPNTAIPTTTAEWTLYNNSQNELLIPLIVSCGMVSGTSGLGLAIIMAAAVGKQTAVTVSYTGTIFSAMDGSNRSPLAYLGNATTLVGGTPAWVIVANSKMNPVAAVSVGDGLVALVDGLALARPGGSVAFDVIGPVGTTALFDFQCIFAMVEADYY